VAVDEVKPEDKIVEPETDELTDPEVVLDEPLLEPEGKPDPKVHPLQPGGRRFEQVYAEAKQAERDLIAERERRIAAEAKLDGLSLSTKPATETAEQEYTWTQLEEFIQQGRITRADAEAHREAINVKKLKSTLRDDFTKENTEHEKARVLTASIAGYLQAAPNVNVTGSEERNRLDQEFDWLVSVHGVDVSKLTDVHKKQLQVMALRNVYGPLDSLVKRTAPAKGETHQGLPGGTKPRPSANPDQAILDGLTKREVAHYNKMFLAGRYPGKWKDVVAEIKFTPKASR